MKNLIATLSITILSLNVFAQGASNAVRFDGNNDAIEIGAVDFGFEDQMTVMGWIKWNVDPHTGQHWANVVTVNRSDKSDRGQFWIQHDRNNNKLEFALELENGRQYLWANTHVKEGEWMHFAGTYDGQVQRFYINGIEEGHKNRSGNVKPFQSNFIATIGNWAAYGGQRHFNGDVDEISIWNRALTQDEIRDLMTEKLQGDESGLKAYYQFDNLTAGMVEDMTGNYDGTVFESQIVTSTAPVGDESVFVYGNQISSLSSEDGSVIVSDFTGNPEGIHIYKVNAPANSVSTNTSDISEIINTEYWGVYVVGNKQSTFKYTKVLSDMSMVEMDSITVVYREDATSNWEWQDINQELSESSFHFYTEGGFAQREYILAKADPSILPIELLSFSVEEENDAVAIRWETASEINNEYFTILRSEDGMNWEEIAYLDGAGNSNHVLSYEYVDYAPLNGTSYYCLKQTDFDGKFEVFDMLNVNMMLNNVEISVYPNPFVNELRVENNTGEYLSVVLTNASGQILMNADSEFSGSVDMNVESLPKGNYYLIVTDAMGNNTSHKVVK